MVTSDAADSVVCAGALHAVNTSRSARQSASTDRVFFISVSSNLFLFTGTPADL